jgi:hypothetical protein
MKTIEEINRSISNSINVLPGMKLSVVWRQFCSAIDREACNITQWNGALAKTFPNIQKQKAVAILQATRNGKYILFPDGSQARY